MAQRKRRITEDEDVDHDHDTASSDDSERTHSEGSERSDTDNSADEDYKISYRDANENEDSEAEEEVETTKKQRATGKKNKDNEKKRKKPETEKKQKRETKKQKTKKEAEGADKKEKSKPTKKKSEAALAKEKKALKIPTVDTKQQRCALSSFYGLINDHKDRVPEQSWKLLQETCFWDFIAAFKDGKVDGLQVRKQESDLEIILSHYNTDKKAFLFGKREMTIQKEQVHGLFHITQEGLDLKGVCKGIRNQKSVVFNREKGKQHIKRTDIEDELEWQLSRKKKDAKKIASLILMYLFAVFFFSNTGYHIDWELLLLCEDLQNIDRVNWSQAVLDCLNEGIDKHKPMKAQTYNGCTLLVVYWFVENAKGLMPIREKRHERPTFIRWSIFHIINENHWFLSPRFVEDLINGSQDKEEMDEAEENPSFNQWVPQASQEEQDINTALNDNLRELIKQLEADDGDENMKQKLQKLAQANEELLNKNADLLDMVKNGDMHIKQIEDEKKKMQQTIKDLTRKLEKDTRPNVGDRRMIVFEQEENQNEDKETDHNEENKPEEAADEYEGTQVDNEAEIHEEPNCKRPIETLDDPFYNDTLGVLVDAIAKSAATESRAEEKETAQNTCFVEDEEQPIRSPLHAVPLQALPLKLVVQEQDQVVGKVDETINDEVIASLMGEAFKADAKLAEKELKDKKRKKKNEEPHSIERRVKTNKRNAVKGKDSNFEYNTPQTNPPNIIDNVNCDTSTWKTLDPKVARHYAAWFEANKDKDNDFIYWASEGSLVVILKEDLERIIAERQVVTEPMRVYMNLVQQEMEGNPKALDVGFLDWEAAFWVLSNEEKEQEYIKAGKDTDDFEGDRWQVETLFNEVLWSKFSKNIVLIPIHHSKHHHYSLMIIDNVRKIIKHMNPMIPAKKEYNKHFTTKNARTVAMKIREFIRDVNLTVLLPDSQDPEEYRVKPTGMDRGAMIEERTQMTEEEKATRRFILSNNVTEESYDYIEDIRCPQQDKLSGDCGPFVLHFMEEIAMGRKPTKVGGKNMRKKMLERFVKLGIKSGRQE